MKNEDRHDKIVEICKTAETYSEVEAKLGLSTPNTRLRKYIKQNKIPMPFYLGVSVASRNSQFSRSKNITESDLCENSFRSTSAIKRFLIKTKRKKEKCEKCGWCEVRKCDGKIPIHLHHKNGNSSDNRISNLEILCPNCHSLTPNYAGKNKKSLKREALQKRRRKKYNEPKNECLVCGKLGYGKKYCSHSCSQLASRKVDRPTKKQLTNDLEKMSYTAVGRKYGVSDNTIRKWLKNERKGN